MKEKIERALEHTTDTKECLIGAGVVRRSAEVFVKSFGSAKAIVVADKNTWAVAGKDVQASLGLSFAAASPTLMRITASACCRS